MVKYNRKLQTASYVCMYYTIIYKMYKCIYFKFCRSCLPSSLSCFCLHLPVLSQSCPTPSLCADVLPHVLQWPLIILPSHVLFSFHLFPFFVVHCVVVVVISRGFFLKNIKSIFENSFQIYIQFSSSL